jgi:hypothetical protein
MTRHKSPITILKNLPRPHSNSSRTARNAPTQRTRKQFENVMLRLLKRAFNDAGLDIDNQKHWFTLMLLLAISVYHGRRKPGHPQSWTTKKLIRLADDVQRLKESQPGRMSQADCCKKLINDKKYPGKYRTLLRRLPEAMKLKAAKSIEDPKAALSDLSN